MPIAIVSLGLDENDSKKTTLEVYRLYFETPFVNATEVYYKMESDKFLSENSVTEYMKKVMLYLMTYMSSEGISMGFWD